MTANGVGIRPQVARLAEVTRARPKLNWSLRPALSLRSRLAERLREALRAEIRSRRWVGVLPSERHLSREFQVGRPTLHLALRSLQREGIVRGRPGKPWEIVEQAAPAFRAPKRRAEVVFLRNAQIKPDLTSILPFIDTLRQKLHRLGFDLSVVDALMHGAKRLDKTLSEIDAEHRPSFYMVFSVPVEVHRWFQGRDVPTLIFGWRSPEIRLPALDFDTVTTMRHAVEYLVRHGHRRIVLLMNPPRATGDDKIIDAFESTCEQHAFVGVTGTIQTSLARPSEVKAAVRRCFSRTPYPTAIIAPDLEFVISLYATLGELGMAIPRKVSVLATWHWPILDYLAPVPTCYEEPWDKLANHAMRIISDYLRLGVWPNDFRKLLPSLREGESVASLKE